MVEVVPIQNKRQWYEYLQVARAALDEVREAVPSWTILSVIAARLDAMEAAVADAACRPSKIESGRSPSA